MDQIKEILLQLENLSAAIATSPVAEKGAVLEKTRHAKTKRQYARWRLPQGGFEALGSTDPEARSGNEKYLKALAQVRRRTVLAELANIAKKLEVLQGSEEWQEIAPAPPAIPSQAITEAAEIIDALVRLARVPPSLYERVEKWKDSIPKP